MPKFYEIFGIKASEINDELLLGVKSAMCHSQAACVMAGEIDIKQK